VFVKLCEGPHKVCGLGHDQAHCDCSDDVADEIPELGQDEIDDGYREQDYHGDRSADWVHHSVDDEVAVTPVDHHSRLANHREKTILAVTQGYLQSRIRFT